MTTTEAFGIQDVLLALQRSRRDGRGAVLWQRLAGITEAPEDATIWPAGNC
jgi:hypothetical protein